MIGSWFRKKKPNLILIIEDDEDPGAVLKEFIESNGIKTVWARDGAEGLKCAQELNPTLIILDIMLPKMSGVDVLKNLKSKPKTKDIPVLMCTAVQEIQTVERCCRDGAMGYITKPYHLKEVMEKITEALDGSDSR